MEVLDVFIRILKEFGFPVAISIWLITVVNKKLDRVQEHTEYLPVFAKILGIMIGKGPAEVDKYKEDGEKD